MKSSFCVLLTICFATEAHAFEISTPVSHSCHEDLTLDAQRSARFPEPAEAPTPTEDQRRAMNDLVFALPNDDAWSLALFIGVRSNDLGSNAPTNLDGLFHVHDDPAQQPAHCIRRQEDDGPVGDATALAACREFILGELEAGGLLDDIVDFDVTEQVESYFRFRGVYTIALPRFAYRLGRATHAMQDVYTHTMRDPDTGAVRHVLNWIDAFGGSSYDQEKDGYPHLSGLDDCLREDTHQALRINRARQASIDMFAAITRPGAGRRDRVTAVVDAALVLTPGCDASNNYCDAPELGEPTEIRSFGCSVPGDSGAATMLVIGLVVLGGRRRRQLLLGASTLAFVMLGIGAPTARAQSPTPAPQPAPAPA
ncbi:MAG: MYXO-CTERM sorting domain-containing protein, partial [Myxococcota bacterium]|nr:MYXO-CTERM sorting domain-containing protein [Myxococcota bacterium]